MYYILSVSVRGMVIVRCTEYRGCPLLGSINAMLNSIRVIEFVRCTEVDGFSEGPLWEVPLYYRNVLWKCTFDVHAQFCLTIKVLIVLHILTSWCSNTPTLQLSSKTMDEPFSDFSLLYYGVDNNNFYY